MGDEKKTQGTARGIETQNGGITELKARLSPPSLTPIRLEINVS